MPAASGRYGARKELMFAAFPRIYDLPSRAQAKPA